MRNFKVLTLNTPQSNLPEAEEISDLLLTGLARNALDVYCGRHVEVVVVVV